MIAIAPIKKKRKTSKILGLTQKRELLVTSNTYIR